MDLPKRTGPFAYCQSVLTLCECNIYSSTAAWAAATRAMGTRKGEQDT